ncbi:MAG: hypothetical protein GX878_10590, partial [Firmicutes bacterium]|nr:hypothetical protein [Bacillota bacterium]
MHMIIIYYSRGAPLPALLAALKHCCPALPPEQIWRAARGWWQENAPKSERTFFLKKIGETPGEEIICLMTAGMPPAMIRRTFNGLSEFMGEMNVLTAASPRSWSRPGERYFSRPPGK